MTAHIIIDGYNLIRRSPELTAAERKDLALGRDTLIDRLAAYKRIKGHIITVVFDGSEKHSFFENRSREKGIRIRFSRAGESADSVIKRMVEKEKEKALVVSSDRDVERFSAAKGAASSVQRRFPKKWKWLSLWNLKGQLMDSKRKMAGIQRPEKKGPGNGFPKKSEKTGRSLKNYKIVVVQNMNYRYLSNRDYD